LFFFRPAAPLPAGEYLLDGTQFTVSSTAADVPPELGARGNLELHLAEEGSGGMCGDISMLLIDLLEKPATDEEHAVFLLQFERSGGPGFSRLVSVPDRFESTIRFRFYHSFHETGHLRSEKLCVKIAGLSQTGTVGPSLDLGCVDPLDETDPRVFHSEGSGCSTIGAGAGLSGLWILLGAGLIVRIRRRAR
jgi:MYXO-CTERM domain-containing protein